jgi:hypothetical protein
VGTYRTKCDICGTENEVPNYGDWDCSQCGQAYDYDECHRIRLSPEQLAVLLAMPRWIPVSDRLPELLTEVLGWHPDDRVRAWFRHSGTVQGGPRKGVYWESWTPQDRECDDCEVDAPSHWMPLPEPPSE